MDSLVFSKTTTAINKQIDVWLVASGSDTLATDKTPKIGYWDVTTLLQVCAK